MQEFTKLTDIELPAGWLYAGFSRRALAFTIDQFILLFIIFLLSLPITLILFLGQIIAWPFIAFIVMPSLTGFNIVLGWFYFALQESSSRQATWGKRICGLRVADMNGNRISLPRATIRYFAKFVSAAIMLLGFIMVAFTERHQALHDLVAETVVLRKE
jgi:uncharacterized RDD family membrane protein YckC